DEAPSRPRGRAGLRRARRASALGAAVRAVVPRGRHEAADAERLLRRRASGCPALSARGLGAAAVARTLLRGVGLRLGRAARAVAARRRGRDIRLAATATAAAGALLGAGRALALRVRTLRAAATLL